MRKKILIVEDDSDVSAVVELTLQSAGYETMLVTDGKIAWEQIQKKCPDLVILDWILPGLTGLEIIEKIRTNIDTKQLPVIFLTAVQDEFKARTAMLHEIEGYMVKPFGPEEMLKLVQKVFAG